MMANVLNDLQYDDMYKQHAIAIPAITQFVREDVLRTNRAAKGIVIAYINKIHLPVPKVSREIQYQSLVM